MVIRGRHTLWHKLRRGTTAETWRVAVHDLAVRWAEQRDVASLGGGFPGLGCSRSLLSCEISFGKALLPRLALPVVVPDPPAVGDDAAAELTEHTARGDNGDLPRPVGKGQDLLGDEVVLLLLAGDDLEQRPVLVEEEVRVAVVQDACAFRGKHEQLIAAVRDEEGSASVLTAA